MRYSCSVSNIIFIISAGLYLVKMHKTHSSFICTNPVVILSNKVVKKSNKSSSLCNDKDVNGALSDNREAV